MRNKTEPTVDSDSTGDELLLPGAVIRQLDYFHAVCAVAKAVMIATAIAAPIKLYSMAAVPDLSRRNAINRGLHDASPWRVGIITLARRRRGKHCGP